MSEYITQSEDLTAVANAIREKGETTEQLSFPDGMVEAIGKIDTKLPEQEKTATPTTSEVVVVPDEGNVLSKVTVSPIQTETKIVTPSTSQQIITPTTGKFISQATVNAMPSGALSTPTISSSGLITSKVGTSGYLASGTQSTLQLTTQSGKTVTPSTSTQTVVSSGRYTTGTVYVQGDSNLRSSNIASGVSIFGVVGSYIGASNQRGATGRISNGSGTEFVMDTYDSELTSENQIDSIMVLPRSYSDSQGGEYGDRVGFLYDSRCSDVYTFFYDGDRDTYVETLSGYTISVSRGTVTFSCDSYFYWPSRLYWSIIYSI